MNSVEVTGETIVKLSKLVKKAGEQQRAIVLELSKDGHMFKRINNVTTLCRTGWNTIKLCVFEIMNKAVKTKYHNMKRVLEQQQYIPSYES